MRQKTLLDFLLFRYLRGYFQKFLTNNCTEETLLFWEYAEDYWRAHPYAQQPFSPAMHSRGPWGASSGASARSDVANEVLAALKRQDAVMLASTATVKQWAESLFLTFLHCNAPYQIGCCSAADVARVSNALDALGPDEMPPFNLFRSIQLSTFAFMRKMFYPDFIAQANYHRLLVAAVHVSDRVRVFVACCSFFTLVGTFFNTPLSVLFFLLQGGNELNNSGVLRHSGPRSSHY